MRLKLCAAFRPHNRAQTWRPGTLLQQLLCLTIASDIDILQFHDSIWFSGLVQCWRGDIVNGDASRSFTLGTSVVCMTVEDCRGSESVDRFFETTGAEESVDFRIFALQRCSNWRVMQDHN